MLTTVNQSQHLSHFPFPPNLPFPQVMLKTIFKRLHNLNTFTVQCLPYYFIYEKLILIPIPSYRIIKNHSKSCNMSATFSGILFSHLFLTLLIIFNGVRASASYANDSVEDLIGSGKMVEAKAEMLPLIEPRKVEKMMVMLNETRRKLGSFQICALCTCCGGAKGYCLPTPCCYAINCNIPNRPFGFCSHSQNL